MSAPPSVLPESAVCASCGTPLQGTYCYRCGEKRLDHHDYALGHFLEHAVDTVTHFDLKVVRGMGSLLSHPGRMTRDVLAGRRVPWPKPLQLFLVVNLVFVFVAHRLGLQVFNTPLRYHVGNWYGTWAQTQMNALASKRHLAPEKLAEHFDQLADVLSKSLIFVFIPLLALLLAGLLWNRRRYYLEHVVTAVHYLSLLLLLQMVVLAPLMLFMAIARRLGFTLNYQQADLLGGVTMLLVLTAWGYHLLKRTYGGRFGPTLLRAALLSIGFAWLLLSVYRPFLFVVTYWLL